jgi:hypothetical protein
MRALAALLALSAGASCARAAPCGGASPGGTLEGCQAACPRDAAIDPSGRCACTDGSVPLLGACVPPHVVETFCGPAARVESGGCAFRACAATQSLDVASGSCTPAAARGPVECREPAVAVVEDGRGACVTPLGACPRGAGPAGHDDKSCERPPACPPGTLPEGRGCRTVVTTGGRVDVGAWAALALGVHGGRGTDALCQPLASRPGLFAAGVASSRPADAGSPATVRVSVAISLPDQDVSRLHAQVHATGGGGGPLSPAAEALASASVGSLLEALRSLGGEATAASVELEVSCAVAEASM